MSRSLAADHGSRIRSGGTGRRPARPPSVGQWSPGQGAGRATDHPWGVHGPQRSPGAVVADQASGRFLDADRIHYVDFVGQRFAIKGPALLPRPPQGRVPVLASAGWLDEDPAEVTVLPAAPAAPSGTPEDDGPTVLDVVVRLDVDGGTGRAVDTADLAGVVGSVVDRVRGLVGLVTLVRLVPAGPHAARVVVDDVLPALHAAGLVARAPERGRTLRDLLDLPRPAGALTAVRSGAPSTEDEDGTP
jgi:hypothetical protein